MHKNPVEINEMTKKKKKGVCIKYLLLENLNSPV